MQYLKSVVHLYYVKVPIKITILTTILMWNVIVMLHDTLSNDHHIQVHHNNRKYVYETQL